jgi:hypothetical protein
MIGDGGRALGGTTSSPSRRHTCAYEQAATAVPIGLRICHHFPTDSLENAMRQTSIALLLIFALPAFAALGDDPFDELALLKMTVHNMQTELSTMRIQIIDLESKVSKQATEISTLQMQMASPGSRRNRNASKAPSGSESESE